MCFNWRMYICCWMYKKWRYYDCIFFDTAPPRWFDFRAHLFPQCRWKKIPSPAVVRFRFFRLILHHNKIFVFGGNDRAGKKLQSIETLKVEPHIWTQLQNSLFRWSLNTLLHTVVLNDRLFVFDTSYEINSKFAVWNDDL